MFIKTIIIFSAFCFFNLLHTPGKGLLSTYPHLWSHQHWHDRVNCDVVSQEEAANTDTELHAFTSWPRLKQHGNSVTLQLQKCLGADIWWQKNMSYVFLLIFQNLVQGRGKYKAKEINLKVVTDIKIH